MQERRSNADRSHGTRTALTQAGRALFVEKGFGATGTPELVERAGVTRGALYHHFTDKRALFQAVVEAEAEAIAREIETATREAPGPLAALLQGAEVYFEVMKQPGRVELMLIEGPSVLGQETVRGIDLRTGGEELRQGLAAALAEDDAADVAVLSDLVSAMFDRAVLACRDGGDEAVYRAMMARVLETLVGAGRG